MCKNHLLVVIPSFGPQEKDKALESERKTRAELLNLCPNTAIVCVPANSSAEEILKKIKKVKPLKIFFKANMEESTMSKIRKSAKQKAGHDVELVWNM